MGIKQVPNNIAESDIREERVALVCFIIHKLKSKGSWCSLLHIQKAYYMVQEMLGIKLGYDFVKYKYGPYCFELTEEIDEARGNLLIYGEETSPVYGLSYRLARDVIEDLKHKDNNGYRHKEKVNFIVNWFGAKQGRELERLTSVYMIAKEDLKKGSITKSNMEKLIEWKPHFSEEQFADAFNDLKEKQEEADKQFGIKH